MELSRVFFKNINIGLQEIGRRIAIEQWQQLPYDKVAPRIKFKLLWVRLSGKQQR